MALQTELNIILLIIQRNTKKRINIKFNLRKCLKNSYHNIFNNEGRFNTNLQLLNKKRNLSVKNINLYNWLTQEEYNKKKKENLYYYYKNNNY